MYRILITATAMALLGTAGSTPCAAQQRTRTVSYHDLDLASATGQKALNHRLRQAVDYVCRIPSPASPLTGGEDQDCRAEVMAKVQTRAQAAIQLAQTRAASRVAAR